MSQSLTTRVAAMSSCAKTDSASPSTLCATMTTIAAMAQMSPRSVVSGAVILHYWWGDLKALYSLLLLTMSSTLFHTHAVFLPQNIHHVDPMSSAAPMDAASSRNHGSVMETLIAMTTQTKPPRIHAALAQVTLTQPPQQHLTLATCSIIPWPAYVIVVYKN